MEKNGAILGLAEVAESRTVVSGAEAVLRNCGDEFRMRLASGGNEHETTKKRYDSLSVSER